jgi:hypothetical protein
MKNLETKASPYQTELNFNQWINHINNELEKYAESNRSIQREDIKWPKGRKVSSHYAIEQ